MTAPERTGWRDQEISNRHRRWGFEAQATDLDLLLCEYHLGQPCALIEYKHEKAGWPDLDHPNYVALRRLADERECPLPFAVVRYWPATWAMHVRSVNDAARRVFGAEERMSEREFVERMYALRSATVRANVLSHLSDVQPPPHLALVR